MKLKFNFNNNKKTVIINNLDNGKKTICNLTNKRAYIALKFILGKYPNYLDSHDVEFEKVYDDTNRAIGDLRKIEGYDNFLIENKYRGHFKSKSNKQYKFDARKFLKIWEDKNVNLNTLPRSGPSAKIQKLLREKQKDRCNITNFKLFSKLEKRSFMSSALKIRFDHRIPLSEEGDTNPNKIDNWQIISEYANQEKLKLCVSCVKKTCSICALAYPEKNKIVISNGQNISEILK